MIWKAALIDSPTGAATPTNLGWTMKNGQLFPITLPNDVSPAPVEVLQMIKYGCTSSSPCSTGRCSCVSSQMSCSVFCSCHALTRCNNSHTRTRTVDAEEDGEEIRSWTNY